MSESTAAAPSIDQPWFPSRYGPDDQAGALNEITPTGVVRAAVSGVKQRQRTAVELHQFQEHTYAEVAAELDMTPKAAKSLLYRARNQLRVSLAPFMA